MQAFELSSVHDDFVAVDSMRNRVCESIGVGWLVGGWLMVKGYGVWSALVDPNRSEVCACACVRVCGEYGDASNVKCWWSGNTTTHGQQDVECI